MLTKSTEGLNENNKNYIEFTASGIQKGFKNQAYDGIYMEAGKPYKVSLFAKKGLTQRESRHRFTAAALWRLKQQLLII